MAKSTPQLIALARQKASVENNTVVTDDEVMAYLNEAMKSLYDLIISTDPSYYESSIDYALASSPTGAAGALPADFYRMRGLVRYPDQTREYPIFLRQFAERRRGGGGPGGYTLDGNSITVVPWTIAGDGPWRLYYTPKAPQLGYDFTAAAATISPLPSYTGTTTLTATANGLLTIDGVAATPGALLVVQNEVDTTKNNLWVVSQAGDGTHPFILTVGSVANGLRAKIAGGTFNANEIFAFNTAPPNSWVRQTLDVTMDNFDEYLVNKAVVDVFGKRQLPGGEVFEQLFAAAEQRVRGMAAGRASEPEQAPIMWSGRRHRSYYDDEDGF